MTVENSFADVLEKAKAGDYRSMVAVAALHHQGKGTARDEKRSRYWLEQVITCDNPEYLSYVGELCEKGLGVQRDLDFAKRAYERAADIEEFIGAYMLGRLYSNSSAAMENDGKALTYLTRAAELGHIPSRILRLRLLSRKGWLWKLVVGLSVPGLILQAIMSARRPDARARYWRYSDVIRRTRLLERAVGDDRSYR